MVSFPVVRGRRFNRQIPPSARWRGPKIAELLNVLIKPNSLRAVAGRLEFNRIDEAAIVALGRPESSLPGTVEATK